MKPRSRIANILIATLLAVAPVLASAAPAFAALESDYTPVAVSSTNPNDGAEAWWRQGWGNSLYPQFVVGVPPMVELVDGYCIGMLYNVDATQGSVIDTSQPELYYRASRPTGTNMTQTLDLLGTVAYPPAGGIPSDAGATSAVEGTWYFHFVHFSNLRYSQRQYDLKFGIDLTPPGPVTGLNVGPALGVPGDPSAWVASSRAHITWNQATYDALSGDAYYQILIDDQPTIPDTDSNPAQGRVYSIPGLPTPSGVTIEDMPPGRHKVSVAVVDRATNQGPVVSTYFNSDPDVPTIGISVPPISGRYATIIANPSDLGGVKSVEFFVDGISVGQQTVAPYTMLVDMTPFGTGTHTFSATVTDMLGRTATASTDSAADPSSAFKTGIFATLQGFAYPDSTGQSPVRYFSARTLAMSLTASRTVDGFAYLLSRSSTTLPSLPSAAGDPPTAILVPTAGGIAAGSLDLASWQRVQTAAPESSVGIVDPIEGPWYMTAKAVVGSEFPPLSSTFRRVKFIVDVTPPLKPTGLAAVDGLALVTPTPSARRDIQWNNPAAAGLASYDALSGDAFYVVTLNGVVVGQMRAITSLPYNYYSVENLQAGPNVIGVSVVDNAGNQGPESTLTIVADPDVPTIVNTTADHVGRYAALTCQASDLGGVARVSYTVDGVPVGTASSAPWSVTADMLPFGTGDHTVNATVTDVGGRSASSSKMTNIVSLSVPVISRLSDTPDPFFPIRRDRYKDNMVARFYLAKRAYVQMRIYDASGANVRTLAGWKNAGWNSFTWNGAKNDGTRSVGTYTYRMIADDGQYNVYTSAAGVTHIRSYILVRLSRNRVRVVFH